MRTEKGSWGRENEGVGILHKGLSEEVMLELEPVQGEGESCCPKTWSRMLWAAGTTREALRQAGVGKVLVQCFSNLSMHQNPVGILLKGRSHPAGLG